MWFFSRIRKEILITVSFFIFAFLPLQILASDTGKFILNDTIECEEIYIGDNPDCNFIGDSYSSDHTFVLTNNSAFQRGAVWYSEKQAVQDGFITDFSFRMSEPYSGYLDDGGYPGADGFAFILQTVSDTAIGTVGGCMGYFHLFNAIAIEFDQYKNDKDGVEDWDDSTGNHIAVQHAKNAEISFQHTLNTTLAMVNTDIKPFGQTYWCRIEYDSDESFFKVYLSANGRDYDTLISLNNFDINDYISLPDGQCYMGFTAATGGAKEYHEILSWKICRKIDTDAEICDSSYFAYSDFADSAGLKTNGDAYVENADLCLSESLNYEAGSVWRDRAIPLINGFATEFSFTVSNAEDGLFPDGFEPGADGFAFVVQNSTKQLNALGGSGSGLGYDCLSNAVAFEFDLFNNDMYQIEDQNDPNGNHFALMTSAEAGGTLSSNHADSRTFAPSTELPVIKSDSTLYYAKIEYIAKKHILSVWLSETGIFEVPVFYSDEFDLEDYMNLKDGSSAFVGFTASTGDGVEEHKIHSWKFCPGVFSQKITEVSDSISPDKLNLSLDKDCSKLNVSTTDDKNCAVAIYGIDGNIKMKSRIYAGVGVLDISNLPAGTYFVYLSETGSGKFVITR